MICKRCKVKITNGNKTCYSGYIRKLCIKCHRKESKDYNKKRREVLKKWKLT